VAVEPFARPSLELSRPLVGGLEVAAAPSAGQGLALDEKGAIPDAVRKLLPGYEYAHAAQSANVTVNNVAEASANQIVSAGALTFDGLTTILIHFYCPALVTGGALTGGVNLWDGSTDLGRLFDGTLVSTVATNYPVSLFRRLTPTAGTHTYSARIWTTTASNFIALAGVGGSGTALPGFIRITRA
jgi:hypothetical protein